MQNSLITKNVIGSVCFLCTAGQHFQRCCLRRSLQNSLITKKRHWLGLLFVHRRATLLALLPATFTAKLIDNLKKVIGSVCSSCTAGQHFQRCCLRRSLQNSLITKKRHWLGLLLVHRWATLSALLPATFTAKLADDKTSFVIQNRTRLLSSCLSRRQPTG